MATRGAIILVCAAAVVLVGGWLRSDRRCEGAVRTLFVYGATHRGSEPSVRRAVGLVAHDCAVATVATESQQLRLAGRPGLALLLARKATGRGTRSFDAWLALGDAERALGREILAANAWSRAWRLNPRWQPPVVRLP